MDIPAGSHYRKKTLSQLRAPIIQDRILPSTCTTYVILRPKLMQRNAKKNKQPVNKIIAQEPIRAVFTTDTTGL